MKTKTIKTVTKKAVKVSPLVNAMRVETTQTLTENGAPSQSTTLNAVLDLFAMGGAIRSRSPKEVNQLFMAAFSDDADYALKCLFYLRDIRGGQGERQTFKTIMQYMAENHPDQIMHLLHLIPKYGRYDDLYVFVGTPLQENALNHLKNAADEKHLAYDPLVFKWLKSINTSSKESVKLGHVTAKHFGLSSKKYRQLLSKGRAKIKGLVEIPMSKKEFGSINYEQVPSKAGLKYRTAFHKQDGERYTKYLESVKKGEKKINASTLYPSDLVAKAHHSNDATVDAMWKALPNYVQEEQNALVMADVSGSMTGQPMDVSIALAIYFAERNKGKFQNHYLTFSDRPVIQKIQGKTLYEKVSYIRQTDVGYSTNLQAAFELLLHTALAEDLPESEMPKTIYIITDTEFNHPQNKGMTNLETIRQKYKAAKYKLPQIIFWNVASRQNQVAARADDKSVSLVSGYSPVLFRQVMENKTPVQLMKQVLDAERYKPIVSVK